MSIIQTFYDNLAMRYDKLKEIRHPLYCNDSMIMQDRGNRATRSRLPLFAACRSHATVRPKPIAFLFEKSYNQISY